jgi:hypothetical protein
MAKHSATAPSIEKHTFTTSVRVAPRVTECLKQLATDHDMSHSKLLAWVIEDLVDGIIPVPRRPRPREAE